MHICFLTCRNLDGFVVDDHHLKLEFEKRGDKVSEVPWDETQVDWSQFDVVLIRTTWDYSERLPEFIEAMEKIEESGTKLLNSLNIIKWNGRKSYLQLLNDEGVEIIPTFFHQGVTKGLLNDAFAVFESEKLVVKPLVGAGSARTFVVEREIETSELTRIQDEIGDDEVMVQPFINEIVSLGEVSLHFFNGELSHTIRKTPKKGDFRVQEEFGGLIELIDPPDSTLEIAKHALSLIPEKTLYARVDLVTDGKRWMLIELELIEPALYFRMDPKSPARFIEAFDLFLS